MSLTVRAAEMDGGSIIGSHTMLLAERAWPETQFTCCIFFSFGTRFRRLRSASIVLLRQTTCSEASKCFHADGSRRLHAFRHAPPNADVTHRWARAPVAAGGVSIFHLREPLFLHLGIESAACPAHILHGCGAVVFPRVRAGIPVPLLLAALRAQDVLPRSQQCAMKSRMHVMGGLAGAGVSAALAVSVVMCSASPPRRGVCFGIGGG